MYPMLLCWDMDAHQTRTDILTNTLHRHTNTPCECGTGSREKVKDADTQGTLFEKWDTLQAPDPKPLTNPFQTAFLLLSEADKLIPLVSKQSALFFCHLHQWEKEGESKRNGGREKYICPTELYCRNYANVPCVRASGTGRLGSTIL